MKKKSVALLTLFAGLFAVTSCGGDEPSPNPNPVITLSANQGESDNTAKTITATSLQTNVDFNNLEVTSSADWCTAEVSKQYNSTKAKAATALSTYYLVLTITENIGYDDRTASITIQDKNSSTKATYKLIQKKQQPPYVTVSNALMKFLASEAT